ncbi:MAG TPA: hypothetical protein DEP23_00445 [Ruminococcaceae bacterium]|nr:hypothetical protein [Oscillospiraceae bacterium]
MGQSWDFFSAAYRDGRVLIGGKGYPAGIYAVHLLNQYYKDDTAAKIAVYKQYNILVSDMLRKGYLNPSDFLNSGIEILRILETLPKLHPFSMLDTASEKQRITILFSQSNAKQISDYFRCRAEVSLMDEGQIALGVLPDKYDNDFFRSSENLLSDITDTLHFYDTISDDMHRAFEKLKVFVRRIDEAERFDEAHLLLLATEVFGQVPFPIKTEYVTVRKNIRSKSAIMARKLSFESYYSFILTDFYEGLHYGHYPRQCGICCKYFLMQNARRQMYCNGNAPEKYKGQTISCRKMAIVKGRKELAADNPVNYRYRCRCSAIRTEKSRGTINEEFSTTALLLAKHHYEQAMENDDYAKKQYLIDISRKTLYEETDRYMKNH